MDDRSDDRCHSVCALQLLCLQDKLYNPLLSVANSAELFKNEYRQTHL